MGKELTELEAVALGWISHHEPATAYSLRVELEQSPASHFSGSAGAIYPLVARLERQGLLRSEATATGRRKGKVYRLTADGDRALKAWLLDPMEASDMFTIDPLRTRMLYLKRLSPRQRVAWLDRAEGCLKEQVALIREYEDQHADNLFHGLASDNARREARARLAWIRAAREAISAD